MNSDFQKTNENLYRLKNCSCDNAPVVFFPHYSNYNSDDDAGNDNDE